jgi:hypothetical protein
LDHSLVLKEALVVEVVEVVRVIQEGLVAVAVVEQQMLEVLH